MAVRHLELGPRLGHRPRTRLIAVESSELLRLPAACRLRLLAAPPRLNRLTAEWIADSGLDAVVFALFASRPDAWAVAAHLTRIGFGGRVLALAPALPDRSMVERELRAEFPRLRLRVLPVLGAAP